MSRRLTIVEAEEGAPRRFGSGPSVRFAILLGIPPGRPWPQIYRGVSAKSLSQESCERNDVVDIQ